MNTHREMLDAIDAFLAAHTIDGEGGKLWDVLTALRGPDNEDVELKLTTTAPIRRAAFPKLQESLQTTSREGTMRWVPGYSWTWPAMGDREKFTEVSAPRFHFGWHANGAARVLGLLP